MKTRFLQGEEPIRDGAANLQRGIETVGGWLYLTNLRLIFEAHAFNIRTGATILPLEKITGARKCWTKFLNLFPLFPNSMAVSTDYAKDFRFVVFGRQNWIDAIQQQLVEQHAIDRNAVAEPKDRVTDDRIAGAGPQESTDAVQRPGISRSSKDRKPPG